MLKRAIARVILFVWFLCLLAYCIATAVTGWFLLSYLTCCTWLLQTCFYFCMILCGLHDKLEQFVIAVCLPFVHAMVWAVLTASTAMTIRDANFLWRQGPPIVAFLHNFFIHYLPIFPLMFTGYHWRREIRWIFRNVYRRAPLAVSISFDIIQIGGSCLGVLLYLLRNDVQVVYGTQLTNWQVGLCCAATIVACNSVLVAYALWSDVGMQDAYVDKRYTQLN